MLIERKTTNECTHYACLMDPKFGTIRWLNLVEFVDESDDEFDDPELLETGFTGEENSSCEATETSTLGEDNEEAEENLDTVQPEAFAASKDSN